MDDGDLELEGIIDNGGTQMTINKNIFKLAKRKILDEQEKEYLRAVIRPFRYRIKNIVKKSWYEDREYISFDLKDECGFTLATFKQGAMYKGMEVEKEYSLEELGL